MKVGQTLFIWSVLVLASHRLQHLVTRDVWPPTKWFRDKLADGLGDAELRLSMLLSEHPASSPSRIAKGMRRVKRWEHINKLFTCPWCFGFWVCILVFAEHHYLTWVPLWFYGACAASSIVGMLAEMIEDD